jgi:hypothetical protein
MPKPLNVEKFKASLKDWDPLAFDSNCGMTLNDCWADGRTLATVIAEDYPEHGYHWVRRIDRIPGGLSIKCSCGETIVLKESRA